MTEKEEDVITYCKCKNCTYKLCKKHLRNVKPMHRDIFLVKDYSYTVGICKKRGTGE